VDEKFEPKAKYVFRTMLKLMGYQVRFFTKTTSQDIHLYYGLRTQEKYPVRIYRGMETALFFNKKEVYPEANFNSVCFHDEYIPFLFSQPGKIYSADGDLIQIRKDIISSAFYFLSCWHDYCQKKTNQQADYKSHLAYRYHFAHIPVVERYCTILEEALTMANIGFQKKSSQTKQFSLSLSHDIDYWNFRSQEDCQKINSRLVKRIKKGSLAAFWKYFLLHTLNKKSGNRITIIKNVLKKEKRIGAQSSFFLLTKKDFPYPPLNYFANENFKQEIITHLHKRAVNLQGSKESAEHFAQLELELKELEGFSAKGFRIRYLNADYQQLFALLEQANVKFDSSIGFDGIFGYRAGISFPFYPYNIKENRPFTVLEIPVVITDRTLFFQKKKQEKIVLQQLKIILKNARKYQSHVSLIWHNHVFDSIEFPLLNQLYWKILKLASQQGAVFYSTDEMVEFWQKNSGK